MKLTILAVTICCVVSPIWGQAPAIDEQRIVDLTYAFDQDTIYWPTDKHFEWEQTTAGITPGGYWYASATYGASEHGGTHLDAPIHFAKEGTSLEQIPLSRLVGPAIIVDIREACTENPDYELSVADLKAWERRHGQIPSQSIVLVHTGWGRYWPDKKRFLGSDIPGDTENLHFPGISEEAARILVSRKVDGVGIDTASIDHGPSTSFRTHQVLYAADIYGIENVAHLERLPATGATLIALPMKIKGGTGGPLRLIALLPPD